MMEKKHRWRFFKQIPLEEYLKVEHRVVHDLKNAILYSTDHDEVIQFILEKRDKEGFLEK